MVLLDSHNAKLAKLACIYCEVYYAAGFRRSVFYFELREAKTPLGQWSVFNFQSLKWRKPRWDRKYDVPYKKRSNNYVFHYYFFGFGSGLVA